MADYRDFCGECGSVTNFGGKHDRSCSRSPENGAWSHEQRLKEIGIEPFTFEAGRYDNKVTLWKCLRGCGCFVWDVNAHVKNVCTTWEPADD